MKCGPDECPIVAFSDLTPAEQREGRKREAAKLFKRGFTREQIAKQFGVTERTIYTDLETFEEISNVKGQGKDTLGRRKSTGRPALPKQSDRHRKMVELADHGERPADIAAEVGVTERQVHQILLRERVQRAGEAAIDPATLAPSAQKRFEAALRTHQRKLDLAFNQRVLDEVKKRIDEIVLPSWKKRIDEAQKLYKHRRGAMDKATFNKIRRALHPDSRHSISDKVLADAFDTFMSLEKFLLDEKDSPTHIGDLPHSWEEWEKAKQAKKAKERARRAAQNTVARR